jgi:Uma2 family endonuclease
MSPGSVSTDREVLSLGQFERLPEREGRSELVRGRLVREPPAGMEHGRLTARIGSLLRAFVHERGLGEVFGAETGFVLFEDPPTVRAPDVAFVAAERLPPGDLPASFGQGAPDLAVEVVSPSSTAADVRSKVVDYLDAGTREVWVVEPGTRTLDVYRPEGAVRMLRGSDDIDGGDVLPGFCLTVEELFAR